MSIWVRAIVLAAAMLSGYGRSFGFDDPSQVVPFELELQSRYPEFADVVRDWNAGKISWRRDNYIAKFQSEIKRLSEGKSQDWASVRLKVWSELPPTLSSEKKLSGPARLMLAAFFMENADKFHKDVEETERQRLVETKLYLILSLAQAHASDKHHTEIAPSDLFVSMEKAWTGLWPFCPEK